MNMTLHPYTNRTLYRVEVLFLEMLTITLNYQKKVFKKAIAVDLAYTSKKYADYTVIMSGLAKDEKLYITNMQRVQEEISVVTVNAKTKTT